MMDRRCLLAGAAMTPVLAAASRLIPAAAAEDPVSGWRRFELTTEVTLTAAPASLWLPIGQSRRSYQRALSLGWQGTAEEAELVDDPVYGARILRLKWKPGASVRQVRVVQTVETRDRSNQPDPASPAEQAFYLRPTVNMPTDGIVRTTADKIVAGKTAPHERAKAIYDWIVDNTFRDAATRGCGLGNIAAMLRSGYLGGKCADISSLMVGLCRAAGIPAREVYGIRVAASRQFACLGHTGDETKAQHCRAEVYLDPQGWVPVDPADVRKVVLEAKLPLDAPPVMALRQRLFGYWEMNWIGFSSARDFTPPGAPHALDFLMYPYAVTADGEPDWLEPGSFRYRITARQI
ncbi:MAG: transglutaminase-like domain-containing protein [Stellaceae bacterium]